MTFFVTDSQLNSHASQILKATHIKFPELGENQLAITWLVYDTPVPVNTGGALTADEFWKYQIRGWSSRGDVPIYPASIVKLFYLVAVYEWLEKGMIQPSTELDRAVYDMIVDSSNDATSLVVDVLTGTTSGPDLAPGPLETWQTQRNLVNRYLQGFNWPEFARINVNQKTWCDGPYGRERAFLGETMDNRNVLTTDAVARLLHAIIGGVAVSPKATQAMMHLMSRSLAPQDRPLDPVYDQVSGFLGAGLPYNAQIWSKAGHTSKVRHDAAYIEIPNLQPYLLVVFTEGAAQSQNEELFPYISQQFVDAMRHLV